MIPMPHRTKGPGVLGAAGPGEKGPFGRWPEPGQDSELDADTDQEESDPGT